MQAGVITFSTSIIKGGIEKFALKQPIFLVSAFAQSYVLSIYRPLQPSPVDPLYSAKVPTRFSASAFGADAKHAQVIFEGISVDYRA